MKGEVQKSWGELRRYVSEEVRLEKLEVLWVPE